MKNLKMSRGRMSARQSGFTLVEIAIVLVIIGLLLGGVLKGQELIENAKVKNSIKDIQGISSAYYSYIDRFKAIPGDDGPNAAALQARGGSWATITAAGNANGLLLITQANVFANGGEEPAFWQALRAAGFIQGSPTAVGVAALPRNAFNGLTGVGAGVTGMTSSNTICMSGVPGKAARAIDAQLDDGVTNTGSVQVTLSASGAITAPVAADAGPYNDANFYTLCINL